MEQDTPKKKTITFLCSNPGFHKVFDIFVTRDTTERWYVSILENWKRNHKNKWKMTGVLSLIVFSKIIQMKLNNINQISSDK